jgi:hypothetical protein
VALAHAGAVTGRADNKLGFMLAVPTHSAWMNAAAKRPHALPSTRVRYVRREQSIKGDGILLTAPDHALRVAKYIGAQLRKPNKQWWRCACLQRFSTNKNCETSEAGMQTPLPTLTKHSGCDD